MLPVVGLEPMSSSMMDCVYMGNITVDLVDSRCQSIPLLEELRISAARQPMVGLLDLSQNLIRGLASQQLRGWENLWWLNLSANLIERWEGGALQGLRLLQILDLSRNKIREIPIWGFRGLRCLRKLDLSVNQLVKIAPRVFSDIARGLELRLWDPIERGLDIRNEWDCRAMCWFDYLLFVLKYFKLLGSFRCIYSDQAYGVGGYEGTGSGWGSQFCRDWCPRRGGNVVSHGSGEFDPRENVLIMQFRCKGPCTTRGKSTRWNAICNVETGVWGEEPYCELLFCGPPPRVPGVYVYPSSGRLVCGTVVQYVCRRGAKGGGSSQGAMVCGRGSGSLGPLGVYRGSIPQCLVESMESGNSTSSTVVPKFITVDSSTQTLQEPNSTHFGNFSQFLPSAKWIVSTSIVPHAGNLKLQLEPMYWVLVCLCGVGGLVCLGCFIALLKLCFQSKGAPQCRPLQRAPIHFGRGVYMECPLYQGGRSDVTNISPLSTPLPPPPLALSTRPLPSPPIWSREVEYIEANMPPTNSQLESNPYPWVRSGAVSGREDASGYLLPQAPESRGDVFWARNNFPYPTPPFGRRPSSPGSLVYAEML